MDFTTPLIFIAIFALASLSLFLVYKFGMKPKSYEEALAEQRQQTSALLGVNKPKPKEKKSKKSIKKQKIAEEKLSVNNPEIETIDDADNAEGKEIKKETIHPPKIHVEFKDEPEELETPAKEVKDSVPSKKRIKKVRPILVRKDKSPISIAPADSILDTPANHFEEIHPKDEFELLRSNSREELSKPYAPAQPLKEQKPSKKSKQQVQQQLPPLAQQEKIEKPTIIQPQAAEKVKEKEDNVVENVVVPPPQETTTNAGKEKKKKKSEFNARQQLTAERDQLINSVRKAELSRTEVQMLIDLLLNKQLEAPAVIDEWSEGKSDPVQKLKKQLAEKEKLLAEEQEALLGVQNKLRAVRAEQSAERAQLQQKMRGYEELLQSKQLELQNTSGLLQHNTQKLQQLQAQINEEAMKNHKLVEDNNALQIHRQQLEVYTRNVQENESMIIKLRSDNEEIIRQNQHLSMELQRISQESAAEKEQQQFIMQTNHQNEIEQYNERIRQLEDTLRDMERKLDISARQENDRNIDISKLSSEKRRLEVTVEQLQEDLHVLQNDKLEHLKIIAQLNADIQKFEKEKALQLNGSSEETKAHEVRVLNLTNELSSIKGELSSVNNKFLEAEKIYITELDATNSRVAELQSELEEQKEKNNELRKKNWKVVEALNAAESQSKARKQTDIDIDELRKKNWKVVEALNAAESQSKARKQTDIDIDKITAEIICKEQLAQKQFIQRLFPDIHDLKTVSSDDWQAEYGRLIKNYVTSLRQKQQQPPPPPPSRETNQEVAKLQAQILHYKKVIDETEGMLNKLQLHIEKEEMNWRRELARKEAELEAAKESQLSESLKTKVIHLEKQLAQAQKEKQRLLQEQLLSVKPEVAVRPETQDATSTIEKLSEEVNHLREQLRIEQTKNGDVSNVCLKAPNCNSSSTNGPALIEHSPSSPSSRASSEVAALNSKKSKNRKKKKKGNGN